ncbi:hypothetical protein HNQ82_001305 [Anoxybacillus tengchongensis]|uniref:SipL SPOCS domain-containing protein n=1 Tax=Anoxybacillus tengchongensis TaxID=576944 RepID=A0A7W9YRU3_9BACL|nr:DUF3794 domain-containing protein [Anoxybacillus tengchongensis]MBB6176491.1 hypothetical protein [Anoxybacillus tengchongensis]
MNNGFLRDFVQIIGIASPSTFPVIGNLNPHTQFVVQEQLTIPDAKPDVEQVNTLLIEAVVTETKNIFTPVGVKVVIDGVLRQKVIYTADVPEQSVHSAHFEHPFCAFINIPLDVPQGLTVQQYLSSLGLSLNDILDGPVQVLIEDVEIQMLDPRTISKCVVLFAYTTIKPLLSSCDCSFVDTLTANGVDITLNGLGVTADVSLDISLCEGCNPTNNGISLNVTVPLLGTISLNVNSSQITQVLCENNVLTVSGTGSVLGLLSGVLNFTLTINATAGTVTLQLRDPITNLVVLSIPLTGLTLTIAQC